VEVCLLQSGNVLTFLLFIGGMANPANKQRTKRIERDWEMIQKGTITEPFCIIRPRKTGNLDMWDAFIAGPPGTPYAGGEFHCVLEIGCDYPNSPPRVVWVTPIVHVNINTGSMNDKTGAIQEVGYLCLDTIKDRWSPAILLGKIPLYLQQLLESPNFEDPIGNTAYEMYRSQGNAAYEKAATASTAKYAPLHEFKGKTPYPDRAQPTTITAARTTATPTPTPTPATATATAATRSSTRFHQSG